MIWQKVLLLAATAGGGLLWGQHSPTFAAVDVPAPPLHSVDVPSGYDAMQFKSYPRIVTKMALPNGLSCVGRVHLQVSNADWKQGWVESLTRSNGSFFLLCGIALKTVAAAHTLHYSNVRGLQQSTRRGLFKVLSLSRVGDESLAVTVSDVRTTNYIIDFRQGREEVLLLYSGMKVAGSKPITPAQFAQSARILSGRIPTE